MAALISIFASSFIVGLSGAMMPGTLLTVTVAESSRRGVIAGPMLVLGHAVLEFSLLIALLFGLAPLFGKNWFFVTITLTGGLILIWLAYGMFRSLPTLSIDWNAGERDAKKGNLILTGVLMSAANPYWILWWGTIGITYIASAREFGMTGVAFFFVGHILSDFAWYSLISLAVGKGRTFFTDRIYRVFVGACAVTLLVFAALFMFRGVHRVIG